MSSGNLCLFKVDVDLHCWPKPNKDPMRHAEPLLVFRIRSSVGDLGMQSHDEIAVPVSLEEFTIYVAIELSGKSWVIGVNLPARVRSVFTP